MNHFPLKASLVALLLLAGIVAQGQNVYYAINNGNWTTPANWSINTSCGSAVAAASYPGQSGTTDIVVICAGRTITWNGGASITLGGLSIQITSVLTISTNRNINVAGALVLDGTVNGANTGDLRVSAGGTLSGGGFFSATNANALLRFQGAGSILAGSDIKLNNNGRFSCNGNTVTNNGKVSILNPSSFTGNGTFVNAAATSYLLFTRQANFAGVTLTATATGNTVEFGAAAGGPFTMNSTSSYYHLIISGAATKSLNAATTTIAGNLTISSGSTLNANTSTTINVRGDWINNLGGTFTPASSRVIFNSTASNQNIYPPGGGQTFYDLQINNTAPGGTVTSNGNISITSARTLTMTSGIFDMGTNTLGQTGAANLTATGGDLRLGKLATTLPELTGTYNITGGTITFNGSANQTIRNLNTPPASYYNIVLSLPGTKTLAGNITVRGNWTNTGSTLAGNFTTTFNGTGTQTITNTAGESFYSVTVNTTGPLTLASGTDVLVKNTLTMTTGNINLNGQTLSLGSSVGGAATLVRTAGIAYLGTFKRYFPAATAISSTAAPLYGLFPVGTSVFYRPVEINSTVNPTGAGDVSVIHNDATTATDVSYNDNEGAAVQRVTDMNSAISTSGLTGGTYSLNVSMTSLSAAGNLTDLKMETLAGPPYGVGTTAATTGTVASPTVKRTGLTVAQLNNSFVVGTTNLAASPLLATYYSRRTGNWNDATVGNATWSLSSGGPSCNCIPISSSIVYIDVGHTVTVTASATADIITVRNGATLNGTANFTANYDLKTLGTGRIAPTGGSWAVGRDLYIQGTSASTSSATITVVDDVQIDASNTLTMSNTLAVGGDLIVDGTLAMGVSGLSLTGSATTISGSAGAAAITGSGTITITNSKSIQSGTNLSIAPVVSLAAATTVTNLGTLTLTGNLTGANAATSVWVNGLNSTLNTTGAVLTTGTLDAAASNNAVNYNGAGAQTVKAPSTSYYDLLISVSGTKTLGAATQVDNSVTIQNAAVLNTSTFSLNGAADLTMTGTSGLQMARTTTGTYPELTGAYSLTSGTVTMNQAGAGTFTLRGVLFNDVVLNGSSTSLFDFASGAEVANNLTATMSGNSRMTNTNGLVVDNSFTFNATSGTASTLSNTLTVGTFTLTAGTLNDGGQTIEITLPGGWTRNGGTFTTSGTALFDATSDQTIGGTTNTTFTNLTIDNSGPNGVTLNRPTTVNGVLTLSNGNILTTTANILAMIAGSSVSGVTDDSFVEGPMTKAGNTAFTFPVGKAGVYRPIRLTGITASSTYRAEYFYANPDPPYTLTSKDVTLTRVQSGEYWQLDRTVGAGNAFVTLSWDTYSGVVDDLPNLRVTGWNGTTWKDLGNGGTTGGVSPATGTIITTAVVTTFNNPFTLASANANNPLPIELLSFTATASGTYVALKWTTSSELNNDYFTIEKSRDGIDFTAILNVKGAGTSSLPSNYAAIDEKPFGGVSYYRLTQTDFNGATTRHKIVKIDMLGVSASVLRVYPNPVSNTDVHILMDGLDNSNLVQLNVHDLTGKLVLTAEVPVNEGSLDATIQRGTLPQGVYLVVARSAQGTWTQKFIVL